MARLTASNAHGDGCPANEPDCSPAYLCTTCVDLILAETYGI